MSKDKRKEIFNIAVVGLSGPEQVKGTSGIGKSCLCNRFIREEADEYYPDHTSVLSQSDFGGRVVNNDHFLYWGDITKQDDNGQSYKFNVIEQTEFIDDQSYQAHRSSINQNYSKRCAQIKITSAEKMMYICTDQLGIESDFETKLMPDGKLNIDGFVLCFDVSNVINRNLAEQLSFVQNCYHYLAKTKKPIVLALTKCDEAEEHYVKEAEKFAANPGGKKSSIPVIETSATENINVTLVFLILAQLIDKTRPKAKIINFKDATQVRKELLKDAEHQLQNLLEDKVQSYHETWQDTRKTIQNKEEYLRYVRLEGKNAAASIFRKHVKFLRDEYRGQLHCEYMKYFKQALCKILPHLTLVRTTWNETLLEMKKETEFENWIVSLNDSDNGANGLPWYEHPHVHSMEDRRIPLQLMQTAEAERHFLTHRRELEKKQRQAEIQENFREALSQSSEVSPGRDWDDVAKFLKNDSFSELADNELATIYDQYQAEIIEKAKNDFQELLYENSDIFYSSRDSVSIDIPEAVKTDPRFIAMLYLPKENDEILFRHKSIAINPPNDNWGARCLASSIKSRRSRTSLECCNNQLSSPADRWQLTPDEETLNVVLLGADGLSQELANEITVHSCEEYTVDGCSHPLRLRSIDGNVSLPGNSFKTSFFFPHGCIAVYSSMESLRYIESSLESTVVNSLESTENVNNPPFQGLPVSILLASHSNSEREVHKLRDAGERLASRIGCPFIDVLPPQYAYNRRFHEGQIKEAMASLVAGIEERAGRNRKNQVNLSKQDAGHDSLACAPTDLKIVMCTRKDDFQTAEVALAPLLNHTSFHDPYIEEPEGEETEDTVYNETYIGTQRRRIAVALSSYENAKNHLSKGTPIHGFILVYDTRLKSSFSIMKAFATNVVSSYPLLILCVSASNDKPAASFFKQDAVSRQLVVEGNDLADQLRAKFVSASAKHQRQSEVYSTFFKDACEHKDETESLHQLTQVCVDKEVVKEDESEVLEHSVPAPRSLKLPLKKANSTEQLSSKVFPEFPLAATPAKSQRDSISSSFEINQLSQDPVHTPSSAYSDYSDELQPDTPNASPTANLLENEVNPDYRTYSFGSERKSPPPVQNSHLYPANRPNQPGKLNPDLLSRVAAGIGKPPSNFGDVFSSPNTKRNDPPYMSINDYGNKAGGVKVLPSPVDTESKSGFGTKHTQDTKTDFKSSRPSLLPSFELGLHRPKSFNKRFHLKSEDIDESLTNAQTPPAVRQTRYSTADLLSNSFNTRLDIDGSGLSRKNFTSSHEDLLHTSPSVPDGLSTSGLSTDGSERLNPKIGLKKFKEKREEKKNKEKEKKSKAKDLHKNLAKYQPLPTRTENKFSGSDYFKKPLPNIIQNLRHLVPLFVEKCVEYIESLGLHYEGIYRVSGNMKSRDAIIKNFDEDHNYDFTLSNPAVHTVTGCLTWFFGYKNLPDPLVSRQIHDDLEEAVSQLDKKAAVRKAIHKLDYCNYATLKYLCLHLKRVCEKSDVNKMTISNMAVCWLNTLFHPEPNTIPKAFYNEVLAICIDHCVYIFTDQSEC